MRVCSVSRLMACVAALAIVACSGAKDAEEEYGGANVSVSASALGDPNNPDVPAMVFVRVYGTTQRGAAFNQLLQAYQEAGIWELQLNRIPVGTYQVHGYAYVDPAAVPGSPADWETPNTTATPDPTVVIRSKTTTIISLVLQQTAPPITVSNAAPAITSIVASQFLVDSTSGSQDVVSLSATATDVNIGSDPANPGDYLNYLWTSDSGGTFSSDAALATTWTPPSDFAGTATLTFQVYDSFGAVSAVSLRFDVSPANARGALLITPISVNNWPDIVGMSAENAQIVPGASATVFVQMLDLEANALAVTWTDACDTDLPTYTPDPARFNPATVTATPDTTDARYSAASTSYTPPATATICNVFANVSDGNGGSNRGMLMINIRPRPVIYGPDFTNAIMSPAPSALDPSPISAGMDVNFTVAAYETLADGATTITTTSFGWDATVNDGTGPVAVPATAFTLANGGANAAFHVPSCTPGVPGAFAYVVHSTAIGSAPNGVANNTVFTFPTFTVTCP